MRASFLLQLPASVTTYLPALAADGAGSLQTTGSLCPITLISSCAMKDAIALGSLCGNVIIYLKTNSVLILWFPLLFRP